MILMRWSKLKEKYGPFPRKSKNENKFNEIYDRHKKHWTKDEERKVLKELRNVTDTDLNTSQVIAVVGKRVGRTGGALRSRFGWARLKIEYLFGLMEQGKYADFLLRLVPSSKWSHKREIKRKIQEKDELFGKDIRPEKVEAQLKDSSKFELSRWERKYSSDLLIDKEDE